MRQQLGGEHGVTADLPGLLPAVRTAVLRQLNGYLQVPALLEEIDHYLVSPGLGDRAGVLGAIALGQQALALSHR